MSVKLTQLQQAADRAEYKAKLAAKRADRAQVRIERERLKLAIVEYKARKLAARDMELIRKQNNRAASLARMLAAPGRNDKRDVLIYQIKAAIARDVEAVAAAQARAIFTIPLQ